MIHIALYQPEIPGNTGNIIRLCANTGSALHLIGPLGFDLEDAKLRRAGLDYHEWVRIRRHDDLAAFRVAQPGALVAFSTHARQSFYERAAHRGETLLFGPETRGLPPAVCAALPADDVVRLPMRAGSRSLNLANAVAVAVYEVWRQLGFEDAQ